MKRFALFLGLLGGLTLALTASTAQEKGLKPDPAAAAQERDKQKFGTGLKLDPKTSKLLRLADAVKHRAHIENLPTVTASQFDCSTLGIVGPVQNQGSCGSCSNFQFAGIVESANFKAGTVKNDGVFTLSRQQAMDCSDNGACNGGNGYVGLRWLKAGAKLTSTADYGPYVASQRQCRSVAGKPGWSIADWGFCDTTNEIASVDRIKAAMVTHGPIASNLSADLLMNVGPGQIISGRGGQIDHAIILVGWDDSKGRGGCWKMMNSWGKGWADGGFAWIEYTSSSVGHDAEWCTVKAVEPPPDLVPPFFITEAVTGNAHGDATGYGTLTTATSFAQAYANQLTLTMLVKDSKSALAATVPPNSTPPDPVPPIPPEPTPVPPGPSPDPSPDPCGHGRLRVLIHNIFHPFNRIPRR